jgi:predicted SAM-dependent methyltransferase
MFMKRRIKNLRLWMLTALKHLDESPPVFVTAQGDGLKLHLGCGDVNLQGWINIDARPASHVDLCVKDFALDDFTDGCVEKIYLCHVLEHFSLTEARRLLNIFRRKLRPEGLLLISVPSFDVLVKIYRTTNDISSIQTALMGGQDYSYNYHKTAFDEALLSNLSIASGFKDVKQWSPAMVFGGELRDWSTVIVAGAEEPLQISLNICAAKA